MRKVSFTEIITKILKLIFLLFIIIISLGPFLWVFMSSFKSNLEILSGSVGWPSSFNFSNYVQAFKMAPLTTFYKNSLIVSISTTILNLVLLSMSSYVLARFAFKGRTAIKSMLGAALLIPGSALLQPLFLTVKNLNMYDKLWGLVLCYAAFNLPTTMYIMISYFLTIPKEIEESAYIDGSGFVRTFFKIVLPLAKPALAASGILTFLNSWNEFQFALTLTQSTEKRTLPIALYYFKSQFGSNYGAMFAATILVTIPSIIVFITLQEQIVSGLVSGSVKG